MLWTMLEVAQINIKNISFGGHHSAPYYGVAHCFKIKRMLSDWEKPETICIIYQMTQCQ